MNYHNITKDDMLNGEGLRVVLWLAGCAHHCKGCQNPQTWDSESGILYDESTKQEIFNQLEKDYTTGITLSGGDPLYESNLEEVSNLIAEIRTKYPAKDIWLYSGYKLEELIFDEQRLNIVKSVDVFVDGEYVEELRDINAHWVGSSNQRVLEVRKIYFEETCKNGFLTLIDAEEKKDEKLVEFILDNRTFAIYGACEYENRKLEAEQYPEFYNLVAKELVNTQWIDFIPKGTSFAGIKYEVEDMIDSFICYQVLHNKVYTPLYICEPLQNFITSYHENEVVINEGINIPKKMPSFGLFDDYNLCLVTDKFIYYEYDSSIYMFNTCDHSIKSDNGFAEIGYMESCEAIKTGEEIHLWGEVMDTEE